MLRAFYALFAVGFALTVVVDATVNETIMLGPGLVDHGTSAWALLLEQLALLDTTWLLVVAPLLAVVLAWNAVILYRGYDPTDRDALTPRQIFSFVAMNAVSTGLLFCLLVPFDAAAGYDLVRAMTIYSDGLIEHVPTLAHLPWPVALLVSMIGVDFVHYWFHRVGHAWRPFWLLWNRPHHTPPYLTIPTTQAVFVAVPLFVLVSVPLQVAVGVGAKLFSGETLVGAALLVRIVGQIPAIGSHTSATYDLFRKNPVLRALGCFYGEGAYHYLHHSSEPGFEAVNLGAAPFLLWDRVFGTYRAPPLARPPVGLTGRPALTANPLHLACAGMMQLAYEAWHNRGMDRLRALFGSSFYTPPKSRDYMLTGTQAGTTVNA